MHICFGHYEVTDVFSDTPNCKIKTGNFKFIYTRINPYPDLSKYAFQSDLLSNFHEKNMF